MKTPRSLILTLAIFTLSACQTSAAVQADPEKTAASTSAPTVDEPAATATAVPVTPAAELSAPVPTRAQFFTDEFDNAMEGWRHFVVNGGNSVIARDEIGAHVYSEDGFLIFDLNRNLIWAYSIFDAFEYEDVRIDAKIDNRGTNNNNVSLVCRYSEEDGWFEFSMTNGGLYYIYHAFPRFDGFVAYTLVAEGGSNDIQQGARTNIYTAICEGDTLKLMINDQLIRETDIARFDQPQGKIGVSASSFLDTPVIVKFDNITISQP